MHSKSIRTSKSASRKLAQSVLYLSKYTFYSISILLLVKGLDYDRYPEMDKWMGKMSTSHYTHFFLSEFIPTLPRDLRKKLGKKKDICIRRKKKGRAIV